jgi:hypothetical protein
MFCDSVLECLCCTIIGQVELFSAQHGFLLTVIYLRWSIESEGLTATRHQVESSGGSASRLLFSGASNALMASRETFYEAASEHMRILMPPLQKKIRALDLNSKKYKVVKPHWRLLSYSADKISELGLIMSKVETCARGETEHVLVLERVKTVQDDQDSIT